MTSPILVPVLGDQLSRNISSLDGLSPAQTRILMMEVWDEATYVKHHKQKIVLIFAAMRHFAAELRAEGWQVDYIRLDDPENTGSFTGEVVRAVERHAPSEVRVTESGEWRVARAMEEWEGRLPCPVTILPDTRFIATHADFRNFADGRKHLTMEYFYREMRRKTGLLMRRDGNPEGDQWNLDAENREPPKEGLRAPPAPKFTPDETTRAVIELVGTRFADHFGDLEPFGWPVTRDEALEAAEAFFTRRLALFGPYQDAMVHGEDDLYHSMLSTSLNIGLLDPLELCRRAEDEYRAGRAPLNSVEGFIRQIIGWREYVRGFYWHQMPDLAEANELAANRPLPEFFWTGKTDMRCLADCIRTTREDAHAHHIQRLMVLGNFCLLAGINPRDVQDWYLAVYADAYEWVELPNVSGMILYADGGNLATKPYAASGNYINKMSNYCKECSYSVSKKTGEGACPFNPLYWHFMDRHRDRLESNHRIGRIYATWDRMDDEKKSDYLESAQKFLDSLEPARKGWARD
ncbi:cryptochrome/photolyase family protein [Erythrobacter dokdonensis]|uniref:Deoxyribodipyrimidine photolyase-related protein n=1 Tax=Erythrobacter dokdonensis DSW-74 TaxID=1300349 RepID=A0A1A7BHP3_9SPHN|nr:cryptochrome/photolyase family protein [Erythrobacter dokdonensis]OBV12073.1 Deoxyribodipyrimidine photolyase-related protein [Erythrobacter dokdonensis DSW-74]